jgi:hypothetical protein
MLISTTTNADLLMACWSIFTERQTPRIGFGGDHTRLQRLELALPAFS